MSRQTRLEFGAPPRQVVAKANDLVRARHNFSTLEQRIFVAMVAQLERGVDSFPMQEVRVRHLYPDVHRSEPTDLYQRMDEVTSNLLEQVVEIRTEDEQTGNRKFHKYTVFSQCHYEEGGGTIRAKFNDDMRPYLLELKEKFTLYLITVFLRLRSKYSTQIYELLKMRQGLRRHRMTVEDFRHTLALEDKYERFSSLKRRVIEQARTELKEKADIYFTYDVVRDGNVPVEIEFFIHENEAVINELKRGGENDEVAVGRSRDQTKGRPSVDPKALFLSDRTQEELQSIDRDELDDIYETAKSRARTRNPDTDSEMVIKERTYAHMKKLWEGA